jgi:hydrogenase maturation protease
VPIHDDGLAGPGSTTEIAVTVEVALDRDAAAESATGRAGRDTLVLGIGNSLLGDDGVGIHLLERMQQRPSPRPATHLDGGTLSFSLLAAIEHVDAMLVMDAADLGLAPGSIRVFEDESMDRFLASSRRRTVHEVGLCDLLDMARLLDCLPRRRALLCIQPAQVGWSESLSASVSAALDQATADAVDILARWEQA